MHDYQTTEFQVLRKNFHSRIGDSSATTLRNRFASTDMIRILSLSTGAPFRNSNQHHSITWYIDTSTSNSNRIRPKSIGQVQGSRTDRRAFCNDEVSLLLRRNLDQLDW